MGGYEGGVVYNREAGSHIFGICLIKYYIA
jgi:hypothetical protein